MPEPAKSRPSAPKTYERRTSTAVQAFLFGLPVAAAILFMFHKGPLRHYEAARYLQHEVECVELILFCCAVSALLTKLWRNRAERAAILAAERGEVVPRWDGQTAPVESATPLLARLGALPESWKHTYMVCRVADVLEFLCSRHSARELDDQLRTLTDNDTVAMEGSYALTRFITWAIPILGFLGTVLGITGAIAGITPEKLETSLNTVTDGLALAFDATALGLGLTMITMFISFLTERAEQSALEAIDRFAERQLAHRFEREGNDGSEFTGALRQQSQALLRIMEQLVHKQAEVWARSFEQTEKRIAEAELRQQQRLQTSLEASIERTQEAYGQRLAGLEKQGAERAAGLLERLTALAGSLRDAAAREQHPETLTRNLNSLVAALQGFETRVFGSEVRIRLEPPEARPELRLVKPGKAA